MNSVQLTLIIGALTALTGGIGSLGGIAAWRKYRAEKRLTADAAAVTLASSAGVNLQKGQQEFIITLQQENAAWRRQVDDLYKMVAELRAEIEQLRHDLAVERRARESAEARALAEADARTRLGRSTRAEEQEITASGDAAAQRFINESPESD